MEFPVAVKSEKGNSTPHLTALCVRLLFLLRIEKKNNNDGQSTPTQRRCRQMPSPIGLSKPIPRFSPHSRPQ